MKKNKKYALIAAAVAVVVGLGISAGALGATWRNSDSKYDFSALDTNELEARNYKMDKKFSNINISDSSNTVRILSTKEKTCRVECYESKDTHYDVRVENDTLSVTRRDRHGFINFVGFDFEYHALTVYLPEREYGDIDISTASGDVEFGGAFTADKVDIDTASGDMSVSSLTCKKLTANGASADIELGSVDCEELSLKTVSGEIELDNITARELSAGSTSGDIDLRNVRADSLKTTTTSGEMELENVLVDGRMSLESTSGDIGLERCDAYELKISSTSGSVYGSLLTGKTFIAHSTSGDIDIPRTDDDGRCEVSTTSGDIKLFIG